jgi:hypothetical protein
MQQASLSRRAAEMTSEMTPPLLSFLPTSPHQLPPWLPLEDPNPSIRALLGSWPRQHGTLHEGLMSRGSHVLLT